MIYYWNIINIIISMETYFIILSMLPVYIYIYIRVYIYIIDISMVNYLLLTVVSVNLYIVV